MSYARMLETGSYIWSDGTYLNFFDTRVSEDDINIFLYKLYTTRPEEFKERINKGKLLIEEHQLSKGDDYGNLF